MIDAVLPSAAAAPTSADPHDDAALAFFGHDLRAALSDVVGGLRLIAPETLEALTRVQIERVRVSAEALARLLEQGLAEMLGSPQPLQPEPLNLRRFLTELDLRWSGRALEFGISFALHEGPDLPGRLRIDRVQLDRVMSNLLGNAFKYGQRGQVALEVLLRADGGLRLTVRDGGPGFPSFVLDKAQPRGRREGMVEPGSGMGLQIAADLTRRMGGRLTLRNLATGGGEALVDLPSSVSDDVVVEPARIEPFLASKRVLIADDNATSQAIVVRLATSLGAEVVVVGDGVEAIGRLEREAFDLLIVDVEMPRLSGLDVIRCLRRMSGAVGRMPVIAVTAYGMPSNRTAILAAGANDMLTKPLLCPSAFASVVRTAMAPRPDPAATPGPARTPQAPKPPAIDHNRLNRLLELAGPETGGDLLDRLISDLGNVQRGLTAADARPDWEAIRTHSHVLISLAGAVGGHHLQAGAEALNALAHRMDQAALGALLRDVRVDLATMIAGIHTIRHTYLAPTA